MIENKHTMVEVYFKTSLRDSVVDASHINLQYLFIPSYESVEYEGLLLNSYARVSFNPLQEASNSSEDCR